MSMTSYATEFARDQLAVDRLYQDEILAAQFQDRMEGLPTDVLVRRAAGDVLVTGIDDQLLRHGHGQSDRLERVVQSAIRRTISDRIVAARSDAEALPLAAALNDYCPPMHYQQTETLLATIFDAAVQAPEPDRPRLARLFAAVGPDRSDDTSAQLALLKQRLRNRDEQQRVTVAQLATPLGYRIDVRPGLASRFRRAVPQLERIVPAAALAVAVMSGATLPAQAAENPAPTAAGASATVNSKSTTAEPRTAPTAMITQANDEGVVIAAAPQSFTPEAPSSSDALPVLQPSIVTPPPLTPPAAPGVAIVAGEAVNGTVTLAPAAAVTPNSAGNTSPSASTPDMAVAGEAAAPPVIATPHPPGTPQTPAQVQTPATPGQTAPATQLPSVATPPVEIAPAPATPNEAAPTADSLSVQKQRAEGLISLLTAAREAAPKGSLSVLSGGAPAPNDPADQMKPWLISFIGFLPDQTTKIINGDHAAISDGVTAWQNVINPTVLSTYSINQQSDILTTEAAAQALDAQGQTAQAAQLRAISAYNVEIADIVNNPNVINQLTQTPPTAEAPPTITPGQNQAESGVVNAPGPGLQYGTSRYSALAPRVTDRDGLIRGLRAYLQSRDPNSPMLDSVPYLVDGSLKWGMSPLFTTAASHMESQACSDRGSVCVTHHTFNPINRECPADKPNITYTDGYSGHHHRACKYLSFKDAFTEDDYTGPEAAGKGTDSLPQYYWRHYLSKGRTTITGILFSFTPAAESNNTMHQHLIDGYKSEIDLMMPFVSKYISFHALPQQSSPQAGNNAAPHETSGNSHPGLVRYYSQRDPAWKNVEFNNSTIEESGCGDTAFSMMLVNVKGRTDQNPATVADWSDSFKNEFDSSFVGETLARHGQQKFGYNYSLLHDNIDRVVTALQQGQTVIIGGRGDSRPYTSAGHIVYAYGITKGGNIIIADPYRTSYRGARNIYTPQQINNGMNYAVAFSP